MTDNNRSNAVTQWLSSHPLINLNALCDIAGYDRANLQKALTGERSIPDKYIPGFEKELGKYGFKKKN